MLCIYIGYRGRVSPDVRQCFVVQSRFKSREEQATQADHDGEVLVDFITIEGPMADALNTLMRESEGANGFQETLEGLFKEIFNAGMEYGRETPSSAT